MFGASGVGAEVRVGGRVALRAGPWTLTPDVAASPDIAIGSGTITLTGIVEVDPYWLDVGDPDIRIQFAERWFIWKAAQVRAVDRANYHIDGEPEVRPLAP